MDGTNVEGDTAIIWRQTGRERKRGIHDEGSKEKRYSMDI